MEMKKARDKRTKEAERARARVCTNERETDGPEEATFNARAVSCSNHRVFFASPLSLAPLWKLSTGTHLGEHFSRPFHILQCTHTAVQWSEVQKIS